MNSQIEITLNQFLEQFYGNDRKVLAVQRYRWKNRLKKDPKDLKNADLTMYNLLLFASGRKEQEEQIIQDETIMNLSMEERIEKAIVPKSETAEDVEINFKKLCDDFIPKIDAWGKSIQKINNFDELLKQRKSIRKKTNNLVKSYLGEYEELLDEDTYERLEYGWDDRFSKKMDKYYNKVNKNLPLVIIRHPITDRVIKRAYTNDDVVQTLKEVVDKGEGVVNIARLTNWKKENEAEYIAKLHDNIDKHKRYIKSL